MGVYSRLSERLIRDGRDSAVRRVVSDTDTPKSSLKITHKVHRRNRPYCVASYCSILFAVFVLGFVGQHAEVAGVAGQMDFSRFHRAFYGAVGLGGVHAVTVAAIC